MLFSSKTGGNNNIRTKTPQKSQAVFPSSAKQPKKEGGKYESSQKEKMNGKENVTLKYKTKDSFHILQLL